MISCLTPYQGTIPQRHRAIVRAAYDSLPSLKINFLCRISTSTNRSFPTQIRRSIRISSTPILPTTLDVAINHQLSWTASTTSASSVTETHQTAPTAHSNASSPTSNEQTTPTRPRLPHRHRDDHGTHRHTSWNRYSNNKAYLASTPLALDLPTSAGKIRTPWTSVN